VSRFTTPLVPYLIYLMMLRWELLVEYWVGRTPSGLAFEAVPG
jgi:hypothetical protein